MDNYDNYNNNTPNTDDQTNTNHDNNNTGNHPSDNSNNNGYGYNNNAGNQSNGGGSNNGYPPYNQGGPNQNYNQIPPQQPPYKQPNNMALASMFVGIFSLLSCCLPPLQFLLGVVGILLVIFSRRGKPWSGFAVAGLVMSILALLISIAMVIYLVFAFQMMRDPQFAPLFNEIYEMYETMPVQ